MASGQAAQVECRTIGDVLDDRAGVGVDQVIAGDGRRAGGIGVGGRRARAGRVGRGRCGGVTDPVRIENGAGVSAALEGVVSTPAVHVIVACAGEDRIISTARVDGVGAIVGVDVRVDFEIRVDVDVV